MNILISAATELELGELDYSGHKYSNINVRGFVCGVGMLNAMYKVLDHIVSSEHKYDLIIHIGIAGSFNKDIQLCEVVNVISEELYEFGVEDGEVYRSAFEIGLLDKNTSPFQDGILFPKGAPSLKVLDGLKQCRAITVNRVHGSEESIRKVKESKNVDVESMEGASHFYCSAMKNIPCIQIRSISNYVEKRNKNNWRIDEALESLWSTNHKILQELNSQ